MRLYIAGPMRGIPEFNFPAFFDAEATLNGWGYETVNPARRDVEGGFKYAGLTGDEDLTSLGFDLRSALGWDLAQIAERCSGVATLPNYHHSKGAKAEVATAIALGLPVHSIDGWIAQARLARKAPSEALFKGLGTAPDGDEWVGLQIDPSKIMLGTVDAKAISFGPIASIQTGEVRTVSETGGEKGQKPAQLSTVDPLALLVLAEVSGFGAQKYAAFNYLKGYDWSLSMDALQRHTLAFWNGEDNDPESGLPHMAHAAWHALALVSFLRRDLGTDTRFKREENAA